MSKYIRLLDQITQILFDLGVRSSTVRSIIGPYMREDDINYIWMQIRKIEKNEGSW